MRNERAADEEAVDEIRRRGEGATQTIERDALFSESKAAAYRARWEEIQTRFVDDPGSTVEEADQLVRDVIEELTEAFRSERDTLGREWAANGEATTEDLRVAIQRYRSFFRRLLSSTN